MSTLPAASSFSGAEGSDGAWGCTSRPPARKSPWAIAVYSAAWSAFGKKSSSDREGLGLGGGDHVLLGAARRCEHGAGERQQNGEDPQRSVSSPLRPRRQTALGERQGIEAGDREGEQHDCRSVCARGLKGGQVGVDLVPEPGVGAARGGLGLGDVGADHPDRERDAGAAERRRQRRRQLGEAECLPAGGVERAQQLELVGVDRGEAVDRRDEHREEADQHDHHELGKHPEAPPEDQQRRDHGDRHGLRADGQRIDGPSQSGEEVDQHSQREPQRERQQDAEHDLLGRRAEIGGQKAGVLPAGGGDRVRRRQHEGAGPAEIHVHLPGAEQHDDRSSGGSSACAPAERRAPPPQVRSSPSRRSSPGPPARGQRRHLADGAEAQDSQRPLAQRDHLGVGARACSRRAHLELLDHTAGPPRQHEHAVGQHDRLLDVVGDEHHGARLARQRARRASPASRCG